MTDKKKYCFMLMSGRHFDGNTYTKGDIIFSDTNLAEKFNSPGVRKFQPWDPNQVPEKSVDSDADPDADPAEVLEGMTVEELKTYAAENEIDIEGVTKKSDILDKILDAIDGE